jgi:hypothetical protein
LLGGTRWKYLEILRAWRAEQRRLGIEKKGVDVTLANAEKGGKGRKEKKAKWWHF